MTVHPPPAAGMRRLMLTVPSSSLQSTFFNRLKNPTASLSSDLHSYLDFGCRSPRFGHLFNPFAPQYAQEAVFLQVVVHK